MSEEAHQLATLFAALDTRLDCIESALTAAFRQLQLSQQSQSQLQEKLMAQLDDALATLLTAVQQDTTVAQSSLTYIQGVPGLITAAVAEALAAGATPAQLKAITDAAATITANGTAVTAAITANTPGGPVATAPVTTAALKP